jgi:DNA-binding CsgD family transcriptional regulator
MTGSPMPRAAPAPRDPWVRRHPGLVVTVAVVLYAAVLSLRLLHGTPADAYSMFYALPVALVASTFGLRAGTFAGLVAVGLTVLWAVLQDVSITPAGWAARVLPLLLLGVLVGHATDRQRQAELERGRLEAATLLHREAIEINDSLMQGVAAAQWSLDTGLLPSEPEGTSNVQAGEWPGKEAGLSPRESEIVALIIKGLTNQEIAERAYLSINSVKSYIRSGYRKIGVTRRAQAVAWGMQNGFEPDRLERPDRRA